MQIQVSPMSQLPAQLVEAAHTHAAFALTRFSRRIRSVSVRLADANGPRGGGHECTVTVHLVRPGEDIVVAHADAEPLTALSRAMTRAARTVARRLERRRSWRALSDQAAAGPDERQSP